MRARLNCRRLVLGLALTVAAAAMAVPALGATAPGFWTMTQADAARSNHTTNETVISSGTVAELIPSYSFSMTPSFGKCGGATASEPTSKPVSNATRLFYYDGHRVIAADLSTGFAKWSYTVNDATGTTLVWDMALAGNTLLLDVLTSCDPAHDPDVGGHSLLVALNAKTGATIWSVAAPEFIYSLLVSGSTLVYPQADFSTTDDEAIVARNVGSGALLWTHAGCLDAFIVGTTVAARCGGNGLPTNATGLSLATGAPKWSRTGWNILRGDGPTITNPQIYVSDQAGHLNALNVNGAMVWTSTEAGSVRAAGPTRVYVPCDPNAGGYVLCALNRTSGVRLWKDSTDNPTSVILASDVAYPVPGSLPLDAATGTPLPADHSLAVGPMLSQANSVQVSNGHLIVETGRSIDVYRLG